VSAESSDASGNDAGDVTGIATGDPTLATASGSAGLDDIRSRKDAQRVLEKVCQYFERNEPSSPIPLLLRRAQRLMSRSFLEIVQDICPDALSRVQDIGGVVSADED
jgi:type VI secretion system protein ImpA